MQPPFAFALGSQEGAVRPRHGFSRSRGTTAAGWSSWLMLLLLLSSAAPAVASAEGGAGSATGAIPLPLLPPLPSDGVLHSLGGTMSGLIAASIATIAYPEATIHRYPLLLPALGFSAGLTAGIAKEVLDSTGFGDPQWHDVMHTMLGAALGAAFIAVGELAFDRGASRQNEAALYGSVGVAVAVPVGIAFLHEIELYLEKRRSGK